MEFAPDGCQPGCSGCRRGVEAVSELSEVVLEIFELFNEIAFPETFDLAKEAKREKPIYPETFFDDESTYKTDEDTYFKLINGYDSSQHVKESLGFIGAVETNVKQNITTELPSPSEVALTLRRSKSSLFDMFSQGEEDDEREPSTDGRDDEQEQEGTKIYTNASSGRNLPSDPTDQSNAIDESDFVEESIDINKSDLTDEESETKLEGKYKAYIKNALSSSEVESRPCSQSGDEQSELLSIVESSDIMHTFVEGQDSDIESKEVYHPDNYQNANDGAYAETKPMDNVDHNEEDSFIELEDASATYSIGNMDSALEESVTCHSRESVTDHSRDSAFEESVTYHSKDSAFEESVTYHCTDSAFDESATEHSNSYEEEDSYESDSHYDEESYESVTRHSTSVRSTEVEATEVEASEVEASEVETSPIEASPIEANPIDASEIEASEIEASEIEASEIESTEEDKTTTEEHEKSEPKEIVKPEDAQENESSQVSSLYDNLDSKDSLFSFVTKDESGSLFDFDESAHGRENERLKLPTSVVIKNSSADQNHDNGQKQDNIYVDEKLVDVEDDCKHENDTIEQRDGVVEGQKEGNEACKPRVSEFAYSGTKTKETIVNPTRLDTIQTGESKGQVKEEVSDSEGSKTSQEDTEVPGKTERSTLKRNTRGRRKIPSRVKMFHQHRRNILKMQLKTE